MYEVIEGLVFYNNTRLLQTLWQSNAANSQIRSRFEVAAISAWYILQAFSIAQAHQLVGLDVDLDETNTSKYRLAETRLQSCLQRNL